MRIDLAEVEISTEDSTPATPIAFVAVDSSSMDSTADDYDGAEAELTSLSWLQSLDITSASSLPTPPCSPSPPPVVRQPPKKLSPLIKAELGNHPRAMCNLERKNPRPLEKSIVIITRLYYASISKHEDR